MQNRGHITSLTNTSFQHFGCLSLLIGSQISTHIEPKKLRHAKHTAVESDISIIKLKRLHCPNVVNICGFSLQSRGPFSYNSTYRKVQVYQLYRLPTAEQDCFTLHPLRLTTGLHTSVAYRKNKGAHYGPRAESKRTFSNTDFNKIHLVLLTCITHRLLNKPRGREKRTES
jgi:hypothetical protein